MKAPPTPDPSPPLRFASRGEGRSRIEPLFGAGFDPLVAIAAKTATLPAAARARLLPSAAGLARAVSAAAHNAARSEAAISRGMEDGENPYGILLGPINDDVGKPCNRKISRPAPTRAAKLRLRRQ